MDGEPIKYEVVTEIRVRFKYGGEMVEATAREMRWRAKTKAIEQEIESFASWERTQKEISYIHSPLLCMAQMAERYLKAEIIGKESYVETAPPGTLF